MSGQRARSVVSTDDRSVHPNVPGVPWWGALLLALTATAVGFAFDAGSGTKELSGVFSALYAIGCLAAILAVRQSAIFTAVVQPPLLLFASVPAAYFLFHSGDSIGIKDTLINCGYPLIERFPLMIFTSGAVLLIGAARWYVAAKSRSRVNRTSDDASAKRGRAGTLGAKLAALRDSADESDNNHVDEMPPSRKHSVDRSAAPRTARAGRNGRTAEPARAARNGRTPSRAQAGRSRHAGPPADFTDFPDSVEPLEPVERPRRPRSTSAPQPRRRPAPREATLRDGYDGRPRERSSRFEDRFEPHEEFEPVRRRRPPVNGANGTHHPISRVRYRGSADDAGDPLQRAAGDDAVRPRTPGTARSRRRPREADSWEYDI